MSESVQTTEVAATAGSSSDSDLLTQTEGYFAYTVIIEEGLSYGIYTQTVEENARPIIIHPDGDRVAPASELASELVGCEAARQLEVGRAGGLEAVCADLVERSLPS